MYIKKRLNYTHTHGEYEYIIHTRFGLGGSK